MIDEGFNIVGMYFQTLENTISGEDVRKVSARAALHNDKPLSAAFINPLDLRASQNWNYGVAGELLSSQNGAWND